MRLHALPEYEPPLRLVPPDPEEPDEPAEPAPPPRPAPVVDGPVWDEPGPVRDLIWRLACMVLEVLDGRRPIAHVHGLVAPTVHAALLTRTRQAGTAGRQHRLRTLHTCRPADGIVELCGTVTVSAPGRRPRIIALAARVESRRNRWVCTALRPVYR
ncbi:MAG TPA: Rv3235 family protein [Actinophytocola sp.]|uniref:Rv3235 family protein n=1 Tax=Actinophytocola sp. TaxID=1872138 RepID=UPI002DDCBFAA|nr:Rv3235 family protein [Actinophytocola sp.]HEV2779143.1 Rv3235 family protein [Actinophytocola sp.]